MEEEKMFQAILALSTLALYLVAESFCRRVPHLKKSNKHFKPGSRHLQSLSFPLMCLDLTVLFLLLVGTIYAAFATNISRYPLLLPDSEPSPPWIVGILLSVNLGRYVAKMQLAIHNVPAEKTTYPIIICLLVSGFLATSLTSNLYIGLCLIGILSEASALLKWVHYLPDDLTSRRWYSTLVIVKFLVTFLTKGVFAIALSCLAYVIQLQYMIDTLPVIHYVPVTLLAAALMTLNFVHMVTFTMFTLDHFRSKKRTFRYRGPPPHIRQTLNPGALKYGDKQPIVYDYTNALAVTLDVNETTTTRPKDVNDATTSPVKEKNCNVERGMQRHGTLNVRGHVAQTGNGSGAETGSGLNRLPQKSAKPKKVVPTAVMIPIPEETASQI